MFIENLQKNHPRLIMNDTDLQRIKNLVCSNSRASKMRDSLNSQAEEILRQPLIEYVIPDGKRLLATSRLAVDRIYKLCLMYRLEGNPRFAERAVEEMLAAVSFPNWNPSHFLDTAEMTHALGIGYDWLFNWMNYEHRKKISRAIINFGLKPGLDQINNRNFWVMRQHNWSQVCNGGLAIGALAIAEDTPDIAERVLSNGLVFMRRTMEAYAPDGGWKEGPTYWHYATRYNVYYLAALESALGTDFGLSESLGFSLTGNFPFYFTSPTNKFFNFADANEEMRGDGEPHEMYWLAKKFNNPLYSWYKQNQEKSKMRVVNWGTASGSGSIKDSRPQQEHPFDLIWFQDEVNESPSLSGLPLDRYFRGVDVAIFRSAWEDYNAVYLALKGGDNRTNHSHLDLGSFVIDALGHRWATDLGRDNYNLPGYFDTGNKDPKESGSQQTSEGQRWTYYRNRTESHNTLLINGVNQDPQARATIMNFSSTPEFAFTVVELSDAYRDVCSVYRGVALINRLNILIQDEIIANENSEILWGMITGAHIELNGSTALLSIGNQRLLITILGDIKSTFEIIDAGPQLPQDQNDDYQKLAFKIKSKAGLNRFAVLMTPYNENEKLKTPEIELKSLGNWK